MYQRAELEHLTAEQFYLLACGQMQCNYVVRYWNVGWALPTAVLFVWNRKQSEGKQAIWPQTIESNRQLQGQKLWLAAVDLGETGISHSIYGTQALK